MADQFASGSAEFLVVFLRQADLSGAQKIPGREAKTAWVVEQLEQAAEREQKGARALLSRRKIPYRPFWIINALLVRGDAELARQLSERPEVGRLVANSAIEKELPKPAPRPEPDDETVAPLSPAAPASAAWNVARVRAPEVWGTYGITGTGIVVADNDTGVRWDHEALKAQYRGWDPATQSASHDYNWHDPFAAPGGSGAPFDDHGHGTHVAGTMVGDDAAFIVEGEERHQVGVAPGAQWIACRNMQHGVGTPASYIECFQWFLAPTRLDGSQPDPAQAPDIINNSWSCTPGEGCTDEQLYALAPAVDAVRAAGILNIVAAGNSGNTQCGTINEPPAIYAGTFAVGATNTNNLLAGFSSIGPVIRDGSGRAKPDLVAPGEDILSSNAWSPAAYGRSSGTSMATPAVSGAAALVLSATPHLRGKVELVERILHESALPITSTTTIRHPDDACYARGDTYPNLLYGWGLVDAMAAVELGQTCPAADFDGDGSVTVADLALQAAAWRRPAESTNPAFDLDHDGLVTEADITAAAGQWRRRCAF